MPKKKAAPASFPIVAVGASAGGLEAFTAFLKALPANSGMAFVLIQHLEPTHESALTQLLSKVTAMPVVEVSEGTAVQPDRVYVIPPNKGMTIREGTLRLAQRRKGSGPPHPIDQFCFALAEDRKSAAIGVLLSGSGSDGTLGLKAIRAAGGMTFAQEPSSAQWPIMPESAIAAGAADFVMPPRRIAAELARIGRHSLPKGEAEVTGGDGLDRICLLLRVATGVDFRLYKQATVARRAARRMTLHKIASAEKYAEMLKRNPAEAQALADDIFIHVTGFFRDEECFEALRKQVFGKWRERGRAADPIRVWVPGCSTGEEVYSLAMLLIETLGENAAGTRIQLFGTDIAEPSIEHARAGIYTEAAVAGVSPRRLKRFFVKDRQRYQIAKSVRDLCVFARHDLAKDPPFSRLDLVSCRNVLIYMGPALQKRTLSVFQYALKPGGFLFLGKSESIGGFSDMFAVKDRAHKIFLRKPAAPMGRRFDSVARGAIAGPVEPASRIAVERPAFDFQAEAQRILLEHYVPPSLVVDADLHIVHFQGNTSPFLEPASGPPSFHLLKMVRPEFMVDLRTLISQARRQGTAVRREGIRYVHNGREKTVCLEVAPLKDPAAAKCDFLVVFRDAHDATPGAVASRTTPAGKATEAEKELASTREFLRSLIAENETAQEEMKAANEEIHSSNEELQSTNEELETAKEELQSSNEELVSLNDELQHRNTELSQIGSDLNNLLTGVDIPVLVVDAELRIRRFTPVAEKLFNLIGADVGRPFSQIASNLDVADWAPLFAEVTDHLRAVEREVRDRNGRWYTLRMRPYRTPENKIDGVLIVLLDVDPVKKALEQLRESRGYAESIVETIRESLLVLDGEFRVLAANRAFYGTFHVAPEETLERPLFDLGGRQWDIPALRKLLEEVLPRNTHFEGFAVEQDFPSIGVRHMLINARRIHEEGNRPGLILLAIEDVTEETRAEEDLRRSESTIRALLDLAAQGILALQTDGKIVLANRMAENMFGYGPGELTGQPLDVLVPTEERAGHAELRRAFFAAPGSRAMGVGLELAGCRRDGTRFPVEIGIGQIGTGERRLGVAFVTDISRRRQAEEALRESAAIMQAVSEGTKTMVFVKDREGRITQANPAALEVFPNALGRTKGELGVAEPGKIPASDRRVLRTGRAEIVEERFALPQGTETFLVSKSPRFDKRGKPAGIISVAVDITERKKIEEAAAEYRKQLQTLTARLIAAQEDQSKHLARELHDVFSQKLAALAMDISVLQQRRPRPPAAILKELGKLGDGVGSLARGIHDMSRQLHPSILDDLGLTAALKEECRVFSEIHGIPVTFRAVKMPKSLPEDIALCLYRVAQEALRNIAQHAGAREVRFHLEATPSEIRLSVQDIGNGFDLAKIRRKKGLGLISMEERVRIVNGVFEVHSHPGQGTRVEVHVPVEPGSRR